MTYCLQYVFMAIFSVTAHLYGDVTNCIVYVIVGIAGWFVWNSKTAPPIRHCSWKERGVYLAILAVLTAVIYLVLKKTDDPLPLLDAITTAGGYVATYYMLTKKVDTWVIWFVIDILYIVGYYMLPDRAWYLMGLNIIWTVMAAGSFISWNKKAREGSI